MKRLERKEYLQKLDAFRDKQLIKVITGVRRCGKSTLLEMYQEQLRQDGVAPEQIIAVNLEDFDFFPLRTAAALHAYVKERLAPDRMTYVFVDEIQHCKDFPEAIASLYLRHNVDIYLTGSNAYMMSGEIATLLSGRYVEIKMLPLSFREYVSASESEDGLPRKYREYLVSSSFPYALELKDNPAAVRDYLEGVYHTIVVKDISARHKISDPLMLESVARFLFDNIGNPLSTKKIADTMTSSGRKIDVKTVERYVSGLTDACILYRAGRYNIRGKQHLKTLEKYYAVDIGMRYMLLGQSGADVGHILENVVYLELLRRDYEVYVGKIETLEVDFVAIDHTGPLYIQVAASVRDKATLERELAPLEKIADNYPKAILTLDEDPDGDYEGIRRINALDWFVGKAEI